MVKTKIKKLMITYCCTDHLMEYFAARVNEVFDLGAWLRFIYGTDFSYLLKHDSRPSSENIDDRQ